MRRRVTLGIALAASLVVFIYGASVFVFNPFTFRQDRLIHLPWNWYRAPLQVEYGILEEGGWRFVRVADTREARDIFREIGRSTIDVVDPLSGGNIDDAKSVWFGIRRMKDNVILLDVKGYEGGSLFLVRGSVQISLTNSLLELLERRFWTASGAVQP